MFQLKSTFHFNEEDLIYQEHFPSNPLVPGSLIIASFINFIKNEIEPNHIKNISRFKFYKFAKPKIYSAKIEIKEELATCTLYDNTQVYAKGKIYFYKSIYLKTRVLILGGSCELGQKLINKIDLTKYKVVASYNKNKPLLKVNTNVEWIKVDLNSLSNIDYFKDKEFAYVFDFLHSRYESLITTSLNADIEEYLRINVTNKIILLREVSNIMRIKRFGRLIYVSSNAVNRFNQGQSFYLASKTAIENIYLALGNELRKKGVKSIIIRPTYIESGRYNDMQVSLSKDKVLGIEEITSFMALFLKEETWLMHGNIINLDKGFNNVK